MLARGADAGAVQHGQQHPRRIGGPAVPVGPIRLEERVKVELVDHVEHELGQMIGWQPLAHIRWEQERLVTVTDTEAVAHGRSYPACLLCWLAHQPCNRRC
jgi:hypothetical protein